MAFVSQQEKPFGTIRIGQTAYVLVVARRLWNDSGIQVVSGQSFNFSVPTGEEWLNGATRCDAGGYRSGSLDSVWATLRRVPTANWLQLVVTIGRTTAAPVLVGRKLLDFLPPRPGKLYFFANGLPWMYWHHRGSIAVRITRTR